MTGRGRVKIAILAIAVSGLLSSAHTLWSLRADLTIDFDDVSPVESRLQRLKTALPKQGTVGYLSEPRREGAAPDLAYAKRFYLTQYVLAPLIVRKGSAPVLVVGHFAAESPDVLTAMPDLVLVEEFGQGVFLWRHRGR